MKNHDAKSSNKDITEHKAKRYRIANRSFFDNISKNEAGDKSDDGKYYKNM